MLATFIQSEYELSLNKFLTQPNNHVCSITSMFKQFLSKFSTWLNYCLLEELAFEWSLNKF